MDNPAPPPPTTTQGSPPPPPVATVPSVAAPVPAVDAAPTPSPLPPSPNPTPATSAPDATPVTSVAVSAPAPAPTTSAEKSLFPNSLPVRQSLPSIAHSFGAATVGVNPVPSTSSPAPTPGAYGAVTAAARPPSSTTDTKPRSFGLSTPYGQLPSLTNSVSPKLSAASPSPSLPPTTATPAAPATHSTTARLPGLTTSLGGATPASSASSSVAGSPAPGAGSATPSYRNPMSVSSMLSGPSRDRPIPSYSSLAASSASATGSATPPQPPVLPPSAGQHLNSPKVENGKSVSPGPPSTSSFLGGLRRLSDHNNGVSTNSKPTSGSSVTPKPIGGEKSPLSIAKSAADAKDGKDASSSIPTTKGERSYPPLPSAFARESPYSSSWSSTHKPEHGYGASSSNSSKESTPPVLPPAVSNAPKTFFSNLNSFSRPQAPSATNPSNGSSSSHRHSNSLPGQPSFPPTFPWATQPSTQQQQQPQQQPPQRTYTDFYQNRGAGADGLRAQEEKRKADAVIAAAVAAEDERKGYGATSGWYRDSRGNRHHVSDPKRHIDPIDLQLKDAAIKKYNEAKSGLAAAASSGNFGDSTAGHKRRLSQGPASSSRPHDLGPSTSASSAPAPPPAKVPKPTVAPFTLADQRKAAIRPPLVNVDNSAVTKALSLSASSSSLAANLINDASDVSSAPLKPRRAHLGRVVYSPFTPPATLLDGNLLRSNIGGIVEVAINAGWLSSSSVASSLEIGGTVFEVGDPREYDGKPIRGTGKKTSAPGLPESVWDLEPIKKRKVWGSDVYTDDSDVLALALHSGWLRLGKRGVVAGAPVEPEEGEGPPPPTKAGEKGAGDEAVRRAKLPGLTLKQRTAKEEKDKEVPGGEVNEARQRTILVRLIVGPTLVRYEGCERQGIKSRSWGNGHDGVSLVIDSVETLEYPIKPHGRKYTKHRAGLLASSLHSSEWRGPPQPLNVLRNGADDVDKMSTDDEQENAPRIKVADTFIVGWRKEQSAFVGLVNEVTNGFERDESEAMEVE